jgi:hypothetical protein
MQADPGVFGSVRELGPWVLSMAALLQVWAIAAWKKFRRGRLAIFESGVIEVGYGSFGPSISLVGTLQALDKDVFVKDMRLRVVKKRDSATHLFSWRAFRPRTVRLGESSLQEFELVTSFLVRTSEPHQYNIFFVDDATLAELKPQVDPVQNHWMTFKQERSAELQTERGVGIDASINDPVALEALYTDFTKRGQEVNAFSALTRGCYWDAGEYTLQIDVECVAPGRTFSKQWAFELSEEDARQLRVNAVTVLREMAGLPVTYGFAYPAYQKDAKLLPRGS